MRIELDFVDENVQHEKRNFSSFTMSSQRLFPALLLTKAKENLELWRNFESYQIYIFMPVKKGEKFNPIKHESKEKCLN